MKILTNIFIVLASLSIVSGAGYLVIGTTQENPALLGFSLLSGVAQIAIAIAVIASAVLYKKGGSQYQVPFVVCALIYVGFVVYVVASGGTI